MAVLALSRIQCLWSIKLCSVLVVNKIVLRVAISMALCLGGIAWYQSCQSDIDYNTHIKPLINTHCIKCHGGVKEAGGFSLMTRALAQRTTESGGIGIIPGDAHNSEMIRRILHKDPDERMPKHGSPLSKDEIQMLIKWIDQGAEWGLHWAYQPLSSDVQRDKTIRESSFFNLDRTKKNTLTQRMDERILNKLQEEGLDFNPLADRPALLRRISLDLIGMPAPPELATSFLQDDISYEQLIDQLMSMSAFGEKWASMWLDIARYADSRGFERDQSRSIWAYRDYVIRSFNNNKPIDVFIVEQLAGDLLPQPTDEQLIATGFHRNTPTNDEGGTDNEEYRIQAVMDRVATTWSGLMGTTMACVQCHGHPYDPFPQEEFYQSLAFLNNTSDADTGKDYPFLKLLDSLEQSQLSKLQNWLHQVSPTEEAEAIVTFLKTGQPAIYSSETDQLHNAALYDTKYLGIRNNGYARIPQVDLSGVERVVFPISAWVDDGRISLHLDDPNSPLIAETRIDKLKKSKLYDLQLRATQGIHDIYLKYQNTALRSHERMAVQFDWFHFAPQFPGAHDLRQKEYQKVYTTLVQSNSPHTLIMTERAPSRSRKTHIYDRGNWMSPTTEVHPDVPDILPPLPEGAADDRLSWAQWIVSDTNPLTSRTFVNRVWQELWGKGIVTTAEDLGSQGSPPTHPKLLDDISYTFIHDYQWNLKQLIKSITTSHAYQQSAASNPNLLYKDPYNDLLSRGPRKRLSAEQIRDQGLQVSGLLSPKMYGPPVQPPQPEGIWETPYNDEVWIESQGADKYRRAVYTFIKRSSIYPSLIQLDMSSRSVCEPRRIQTNTPLQALVTLNDPVYVEMANSLASRMQNEGGSTLESQIDYAYQMILHKKIPNTKSIILQNLYVDARALLDNQSMSYPQEPHDLAMSTVAQALLNLDEVLNN